MAINPSFPFTFYLTNVSHMDFLNIFCNIIGLRDNISLHNIKENSFLTQEMITSLYGVKFSLR